VLAFSLSFELIPKYNKKQQNFDFIGKTASYLPLTFEGGLFYE